MFHNYLLQGTSLDYLLYRLSSKWYGSLYINSILSKLYMVWYPKENGIVAKKNGVVAKN